MNQREINIWQWLGFAVTALGGTLLHFLYDLTKGASWAAPFSGVNESTWEHMKLLFWPMLIFAIFERLFFKGKTNFWWIKLKGILLGLLLIPVLFYTYNGAVGKSPDWLNITIFFVSAAVAYLWESKQLQKSRAPGFSNQWALILIGLIGALFVIFTYAPPTIGLFCDPITGGYGI